jgi:hypothetical protein
MPAKPKSYLGIIIAACLVFVVIVVGVLVAVGFFVRQEIVKRQAMAQFEKTAAEERTKMADAVKEGNVADGNAALGRMKDQLGKSAAQMSGPDAAAARAMASYMGKMQGQLGEYGAVLNRLTKEKVLSFDIRDRATIEPHRQLVHELLAANAKLKNALQHGEELLGAELDAEKVPETTRNQTLAGFNRSQAQLRPLQMRVRECDEILGESALSVLDLLDQSWGHWERDETNGRLRFHDNATLASFNELIKKIQAAAADQAKAQQELVAKAKAITAQ